MVLDKSKNIRPLEYEKLTKLLFHSIATEFTRPLDLIALNSDYISMTLNRGEENFSSDAVAESLKDIQSSTSHLNRLLDNFVAVAAILNGDLTSRIEAVDLCNMIRIMCANSAEIQRMIGVELRFDAPKEQELIVNADSTLAERICLNLLSNSLQACKPGGKVCFKLEKGENLHVLTVEDDGIGFPKELIENAFSSIGGNYSLYERNLAKGAGVGLFLCGQYCKEMGWEIEVECLKKGTKIKLLIPTNEHIYERVMVLRSSNGLQEDFDEMTKMCTLRELRSVKGLENLARR